MGHCQFMPSTYLDHATSGDEGASPDIWDSLDHVFASMGNYLHNLGWNLTEPICYLQKAPLTDKVYLVFNNYELLLKWNKSNNFALSIGLFAEQLERS